MKIVLNEVKAPITRKVPGIYTWADNGSVTALFVDSERALILDAKDSRRVGNIEMLISCYESKSWDYTPGKSVTLTNM